MSDFFVLFLNIVIPVTAGLVYFAMALYVKHIGPMRTLIAGHLTYRGAYWGFLAMGIYLASRPVQILMPHPWPLIINNIREFFMIGLFGPAVFLAMLSFAWGAGKMAKSFIVSVLCGGIALAVIFVVTNVFAIGGSEEIFQVGKFHAYDGLWFKNDIPQSAALMKVLFTVRVINPILLVFVAGVIVLRQSFLYPLEKRKLYDNMPKKLLLMGISCFFFSVPMLAVGLLSALGGIHNQWWIYYVGALVAGLLETYSLSLPMRSVVQVSEHS